MALLIPREKEFWQRKPTSRQTIDYSNQFADSLVACVVTDEVDLVSGIKYRNRVDYGEYIHFDDVGYNAELDTQAGTIIFDAREDTLTADWSKIGYGHSPTVEDRQMVAFCKDKHPTNRWIWVANGNGSYAIDDTIPTVEKGIICISYDSNNVTTDAVHYHRNSQLTAAKAWFGPPLTTDTRKRISCEGTHAVKFFHILNRALDDDESVCLSDAPYQVLKKKKTIFLLPTEVLGSLDSTTSTTTSTASGKLGAIASLSEVLGGSTNAGTGSLKNVGSLSKVLSSTSQDSVGTLSTAGVIAETLTGSASSASGVLGTSGSLTETLDATPLSGSGVISNTGYISEVTGNTSSVVYGLLSSVGNVGETLSNTIIRSSGVVGVFVPLIQKSTYIISKPLFTTVKCH